MKRIGIDCRFASSPTGLGRYVRELVPALLAESEDIEWVLFVGEKKPKTNSRRQGYGRQENQKPEIVKVNIPHYSIQEQLFWPFVIKKAKLDLLFVPHFNVPLYCPVPFVVTIHDLILDAYPNQASALKQKIYKNVLHSALRRAQSIISVSAFTGSELTKYHQKDSTIITEAIHADFTRPSEGTIAEVRDRYQLTANYFLYVGNAKEHKNVQCLIDAFTKADLEDAQLILVSPGPEAEKLQVSGSIRRLAGVDDADLVALYSGARAFVTASFYEGFCLPILEARACGCPVLASNTTAIPELAAEGVLLIEPTVDAFTAAFKNWKDPSQVEPPTRTWADVAKETLVVTEAA